MACETTTDTPINVNPVDVITIIKQDNNIRSTEKQHITNRAMTGVRAYTLVGPSANMSDPYTSEYITMQPLAVYTLLYSMPMYEQEPWVRSHETASPPN